MKHCGAFFLARKLSTTGKGGVTVMSTGEQAFLYGALGDSLDDFAWCLALAFDVAAGGDRFVIVKPDPVPEQELHVIVDWFDELRRRVPIR